MLSSSLQNRLIEQAIVAAGNAYAPYSGYPVGAALLTESGEIFIGCNVENASYGLTICAERSAIFSARCAGHSKWTAIAIYAPNPPAPLPCGACRQVLAEGGNAPLVIVVSHDHSVHQFDFDQLLPHSFECKA
jgi:cytidine deaminase